MRTKRVLTAVLFMFTILAFGILIEKAHAKPPAAAPAAPTVAGRVGVAASCPTGVLHCTNLTWTAPASGPAPTGYNVYQSTTAGGCSTVTATTCQKMNTSVITTTSFTVAPLAASTTYFNVVTAVDAAGESPASNQYTGTTQPDPVPNAPTNLSGVTQ